MVLESLFGPKKALSSPWRLFFLGLMYASIGTFLGLWIFKNQASLVLVFLTVLATVPLMYKTMKYEEKRDLKFTSELKLIKKHSRALIAFMFLFFGFVIAFSIWYLLLPDRLLQITFASQIETIRSINGGVISNVISPGASSLVDISATKHAAVFMQIFSNNIKVLLFCIFFSFFYGAGAIFILTWNASVIAVAIGNLIRSKIGAVADYVGLLKIGSYLGIFSLGLLRYAIHGSFEILSYFTAGLAGGIISVAVIKHDFGSLSFKKILADSVDLIVLAIVLVFLAAILEVYVTPIFF
ncbi:MAG: stage II sporulation protein M [Candidatus Woesearchaeota archaeon]